MMPSMSEDNHLNLQIPERRPKASTAEAMTPMCLVGFWDILWRNRKGEIVAAVVPLGSKSL